MKAGQTVKFAVLIPQLSRTQAALALSAPPKEALEPPDVFERRRAGVLVFGGLYKCGKCTQWHVTLASGFVLEESGAAVTNYHVVNKTDGETLVAMTWDGRVFPVREVLAADKPDDVAIVRLGLPAGTRLEAVPLAENPRVGEPITVLSHPDQHLYMFTSGIVARYFSVLNEGRVVTRMAITADYARGSSGAPVFDARGAIAGIASQTDSVYYKTVKGVDQNLQMVLKHAIPASAIRRLIPAAKNR